MIVVQSRFARVGDFAQALYRCEGGGPHAWAMPSSSVLLSAAGGAAVFRVIEPIRVSGRALIPCTPAVWIALDLSALIILGAAGSDLTEDRHHYRRQRIHWTQVSVARA